MSAAPDDQAGRNPQAHHVSNIPMPARTIARGDGFPYARAEQRLTIIAGGHTPDRDDHQPVASNEIRRHPGIP